MVDITAEARLLLAAIRQTRQRFGASHVINVLRGSKSARVLTSRHDQLLCHGSGRHLPAERWRLIADRLIECGLLEVDMEYGILRLGSAGLDAENGEPIYAVMDEIKSEPVKSDLIEYDPGLFEHLRRLRRELALSEGIAPFMVFSDRSLMEMAAQFPQSLEELRHIHGVGERKSEAYGERFLQAIDAFVKQHGKDGERLGFSLSRHLENRGKRHTQVGEAFAAGRSLASIQSEWGVTRNTVLQNLYRYLGDGGALDSARLEAECQLPSIVRARAIALFDELGHERLGPVFSALDDAVSYDDLHLLRLIRLSAGENPAVRGPSHTMSGRDGPPPPAAGIAIPLEP